MGRIDPNDADRYQKELNGEWFKLANDGDIATVQFMVDKFEDLDVFACHKIKLGEKERYVDCLRSYDEPIDKCPFCAEGYPVKPIRFVLMFDHSDEKVKIWERGKQFIATLQGYMARYVPLSSYVFEIERKGRAGDKETKYNVYPMDRVAPFDLSQVEKPEFLGGLILEKTAEEMEIFIATGFFPSDEEEAPAAPVTRRVSAAPARPAARPAASTGRVQSAVPNPARPAPRTEPPAPIAPVSRRAVAPPVYAQPVAEQPPLRGPARTGRKPPEVF